MVIAMYHKKNHNLLFLKRISLIFILPLLCAVFLNSACQLKVKAESEVANTLVPDSSRITVLSQNTMLIPINVVAPEYTERTVLISEMLSKGQFDIAGLQEVFAGASQDSIMRAWHQNAVPDISCIEDLWQPITRAKEVSELAVSQNKFGIKILDAKPNNKPAKISFGPYYVLGPDTESGSIIKQDSGLLILSKLPIIAAGAFSFSDAQGSDRLANKGVVYARIKTGPSSDDYIHFFNTHLQSHGYGETRFKNLSELLVFVSNAVADDREEGIHPIIIVGDFNIRASLPDGWIKKAAIISAPPGQDMPDDSGSTLNMSADYDEFMNYLKSISNFKDLWEDFYPDDPGFTWIGKGWKVGAQNPYGTDGNPIAIENGPPERIDYVVFYKGSNNLHLNPISIKLFPENSSGFQVSDHLGLVSVFELIN